MSNKSLKLILIVILSLAIAHVLVLSEFSFWAMFSVIFKKDFLMFLTNTVVAVLASVLAAIIYDQAEAKKLQKRIDTLYGDTPNGLIDSMIEKIKENNGDFYQDYHITYYLEATTTPEMFILSIDYDYKKKIKSPRLTFKLESILDDKEFADFIGSDHHLANEYAYNELFYLLDERVLLSQLHEVHREKITNRHSVSGLVVDNHPINLQKTGGRHEYAADIPDHIIQKNIPIGIKYKIKFPVMAEDYVYCILERPTKGVQIKFVYNTIHEDITVEHADFLTLAQGRTYDICSTEQREISVGHAEQWALQKSGVVFFWRKNRQVPS